MGYVTEAMRKQRIEESRRRNENRKQEAERRARVMQAKARDEARRQAAEQKAAGNVAKLGTGGPTATFSAPDVSAFGGAPKSQQTIGIDETTANFFDLVNAAGGNAPKVPRVSSAPDTASGQLRLGWQLKANGREQFTPSVLGGKFQLPQEAGKTAAERTPAQFVVDVGKAAQAQREAQDSAAPSPDKMVEEYFHKTPEERAMAAVDATVKQTAQDKEDLAAYIAAPQDANERRRSAGAKNAAENSGKVLGMWQDWLSGLDGIGARTREEYDSAVKSGQGQNPLRGDVYEGYGFDAQAMELLDYLYGAGYGEVAEKGKNILANLYSGSKDIENWNAYLSGKANGRAAEFFGQKAAETTDPTQKTKYGQYQAAFEREGLVNEQLPAINKEADNAIAGIDEQGYQDFLKRKAVGSVLLPGSRLLTANMDAQTEDRYWRLRYAGREDLAEELAKAYGKIGEYQAQDEDRQLAAWDQAILSAAEWAQAGVKPDILRTEEELNAVIEEGKQTLNLLSGATMYDRQEARNAVTQAEKELEFLKNYNYYRKGVELYGQLDADISRAKQSDPQAFAQMVEEGRNTQAYQGVWQKYYNVNAEEVERMVYELDGLRAQVGALLSADPDSIGSAQVKGLEARIGELEAAREQYYRDASQGSLLTAEQEEELAFAAASMDEGQLEDYMAYLQRELNHASAEELMAQNAAFFGGDNPTAVQRVGAGAWSAIASLGNVGAYLANAGQAIKNAVTGEYEPVDTYSAPFMAARQSQQGREIATKGLSPMQAFWANTGISALQMALNLPLGPTGAALSMGGAAAGDAALSALENGASPEEAFAYSTIYGGASVALDRIGLENLFAGTQAFAGLGKKGVKELFSTAAKNAAVEGMSEAGEEVVDILADMSVLGSKGDVQRYMNAYLEEHPDGDQNLAMAEYVLGRVGQAAAGGAVMGFGFSLASNAAGMVSDAANGGINRPSAVKADEILSQVTGIPFEVLQAQRAAEEGQIVPVDTNANSILDSNHPNEAIDLQDIGNNVHAKENTYKKTIAQKIEENSAQLEGMETVAKLSGNEFAKGEVSLIDQVSDYFDDIGNIVNNPDIGEVILNRRGIKNSIAHGIGRDKAIAFKAVPQVIENGKIIETQTNWKGRGKDTFLIAAPIEIKEQEHYLGAIVTRTEGNNRFYLHEVVELNKTKDGSATFKTGGQDNLSLSGDAEPSLLNNIPQIDTNVNGGHTERNSADPGAVDGGALPENTVAAQAANGGINRPSAVKADEILSQVTGIPFEVLQAQRAAEEGQVVPVDTQAVSAPAAGGGMVPGAYAPKATEIKNPYTGKMPTQVKSESIPVEIDTASVEAASQRMAGALNQTEISFSKYLKKIYNALFDSYGGARGIAVDGATFDGKPYVVTVNKKVVGKVISDPLMYPEKLAVFDVIDDVVENGNYVGSSKYIPKSPKASEVVRYDYFETPVRIGGGNYIVTFDVEVLPSTNNYRTHKVINEIDLVKVNSADTGPKPAAPENQPSLNTDIPQKDVFVKDQNGASYFADTVTSPGETSENGFANASFDPNVSPNETSVKMDAAREFLKLVDRIHEREANAATANPVTPQAPDMGVAQDGDTGWLLRMFRDMDAQKNGEGALPENTAVEQAADPAREFLRLVDRIHEQERAGTQDTSEADWFGKQRRKKKNKRLPGGGELTGYSEIPQYQEFTKQVENCHPDARKILEKTLKRADILLVDDKHSRYYVKDDYIQLSKSAQPSTLAHEAFHRYDMQNGIFAKYKFGDVLRKEYEDMALSPRELLHYIRQAFPDACETNKRGTLYLKPEYRGISDILSGLTKNRVIFGYGHKNSYWGNSDTRLGKEAWAQMGRILYENNPRVIEMLRKLFPKFYAYAMMAIEEMK